MKKIITLAAAIGLMITVASPAKAWYGGYYGGWGYGGYGAALGIGAGAALLGGIIGGAIASQPYYGGGYGYGYPAYGYAPVYRRQYYVPAPAPVYEVDEFYGW